MQRNVAWIHGDQAKGRKDIHVSLNATALQVLEKRVGIHPKFVFTYKDKRIGQVSTKAWYKALKRAGIENFRWHDLRHTWASWLAQGGVPLNVIQEMEHGNQPRWLCVHPIMQPVNGQKLLAREGVQEWKNTSPLFCRGCGC